MNDIHPLLEWLNRGYYKFLDLDYEYNGLVIHHPQGGIPYKMGTWTDGKLSYEGGFKDFKDWLKETKELKELKVEIDDDA